MNPFIELVSSLGNGKYEFLLKRSRVKFSILTE